MKIKSLGLENVRSVEWIAEKNALQLIDQRLIPFEIKFNLYSTVLDICEAIKTMVVRGAPAIGATAAYATALAIKEIENIPVRDKKVKLEEKLDHIQATRPTAVDLKNYSFLVYQAALETNFSFNETLLAARRLYNQILEECKLIREKGVEIIEDGDTILTHCNAGPLATIDYGTALGPIINAHNQSKNVHVFVDETRPRLQGAKITGWELEQEGISHQIISDSAAAYLMSIGKIDKVILGADRCLKDGTISNKIGTYSVAIAANFHKIPFYSAFPWSTLDLKSESIEDFKIELRDVNEVKYVKGKEGEVLVANPGSDALNPAFDITPPELITGYITSRGVLNQEELINEINKK
ncbi:MAG: S-methyl-5-thioribose-1-phosphate isomerase [Candidatus Heimdallarchaeaceae archaeon]